MLYQDRMLAKPLNGPAAWVQRARNQGKQCDPRRAQYPALSPEMTHKMVLMAHDASTCIAYPTGILHTSHDGIQNPESLDKQLTTGTTFQQAWANVSLSLSPVQWLESVIHVLGTTVGYLMWNFEDLVQHFATWDGSAWGLITNVSFLWRILISGGILIGISFAGPALDAFVRIVQIAWDVLVLAVRGSVGVLEEVWGLFSQWIQFMERVFTSL